MPQTAFVLGGTGLIGRALVPLLGQHGFEVTVGARTALPEDFDASHVQIDRADDDRFEEVAARDFDIFVDVVAYRQSHAEQLTRLNGRVGSLVVISTAAVYADTDGKTLLGSELADGAPISESDPVVAAVPDGSDYAGGKVAVEETLLDSELPATILRPGAIFGPGDRAAREWHFVKRVLDDRKVVLLAHDGTSTFHQVSSAHVAHMTLLAAAQPGAGVVNCGDDEPRTIRAIADTVAAAMNHEWETITIPGKPSGTVGETPWSVPKPFLLDMTRAHDELGFSDRQDYPSAIARTCEWLVAATKNRAWEEALPQAAEHYGTLFDYAAEDEFLRDLSQ